MKKEILARNLGLYFDAAGTACVKVWAPEARCVELVLESSAVVLHCDEEGYWSAPAPGVQSGDLYWFRLDNERHWPDPASVSQPEGVHGASQALQLGYPWSDSNWVNPPLSDYFLYEVHTGTFSPEGNFQGIIDRLDHLLALGITALELMPLACFPGDRNWGYDGVFPFAVHPAYGAAAGLQRLVNECHQKGIAVVLDVVYNHFGPEGNILHAFGPYLTDKYHTPWGMAVNMDDRGCDGVRNYLIENVLMWFRDFHIDALRLDAVHAIKDFSALHILQQIRKATDLLSAQTGRAYYLIAECDLNDPRYIDPLDRNGLGMDAQWSDEFHHALRVAAGEPGKGYYSDFAGITDLAKAYEDAYVYTGQYSAERAKRFGLAPYGHPGAQFIVFSQNHDQVGNRMLGERTSQLMSFEMQKLLAGAVFFSPFIPMIFMGEEWAEVNPFLYFVSHSDPDLIEAVREGRRQEFSALQGSGEAPDPQDPSSYERSKLNWSLLSKPAHQTMFRYYAALIAFRKSSVLLSDCDRSGVQVHCYSRQNSLILERGHITQKELFLICLNFSDMLQEIPVPKGVKLSEEVFNSADRKWLGPGALFAQAETGPYFSIQPQSLMVYSALYV